MQSAFVTKIKTINPWDAALMVIVGLVGLFSGIWASHIILDDAMITFTVAENLAHGNGFVYNIGERVQVTTTPLYTMVLAIGMWPFGSAPQAALLLNIALAAIIPMLAYDVGRRLAGKITGVGSALLLIVAPLLIIAFSMESYMYAALILASTNAYIAKRYRLAGVIIGITALTRGDAALIGAAILIYDVLASRRFRWGMIFPAIGIPLLWYIFATFYYGWPFPATLQAKAAQGSFNWLNEHFLSGFGEIWEDWVEDYSTYFYLFPVLIVIGLIPVIRSERQWFIFILHGILYIATFEGLGVTFAQWYYAPLMPGLALLTARGVQVIAQGVAGLIPTKSAIPRHILSTGIAAGFIAVLLVTLYPVTKDIVDDNPDWKAIVYPQAARWIDQNTNTNTTLATIDIGHLGYWSNRHIIDIVGLAQPDVARHIAEGDFGYAISHYQPDMILLGSLWLQEIQSRPWFQQDYVPRHNMRIKGMSEPLILFTRREGVKVNSDTIPPAEIKPLDVDFNRQITLTGYHINPSPSPGGLLNLSLIWQVDAPIEVDFTVFAQLIDSEGNIVGQGDNKPQRGYYPTPYWQPGEQIIDSYTIPLAANLPPSSYEIAVGFYEADSGNRLQILDDAGQFKADHVKLSGIKIVE